MTTSGLVSERGVVRLSGHALRLDDRWVSPSRAARNDCAGSAGCRPGPRRRPHGRRRSRASPPSSPRCVTPAGRARAPHRRRAARWRPWWPPKRSLARPLTQDGLIQRLTNQPPRSATASQVVPTIQWPWASRISAQTMRIPKMINATRTGLRSELTPRRLRRRGSGTVNRRAPRREGCPAEDQDPSSSVHRQRSGRAGRAARWSAARPRHWPSHWPPTRGLCSLCPGCRSRGGIGEHVLL